MSSNDSSVGVLNQPIRGNRTFGRDRLLDMPRALLFHSANQTLTDTVATTLSFDGESYMRDGMHSTTTNNSRITCRTQAIYLLTANAFFAASAAGTYRVIRFILNGVTDIGGEQRPPVNSGLDGTRLACATPYALYADDYVEVVAIQNSGGPLDVLTPPSFSACLISTF